MQIPHGRIVSIDSDDAHSVVVEVEATVACKRCAEGKGCGAGLLGGPAKSRQVSAVLTAGLRVQNGDQVSLDLAPRNLLQAAIIVYGYPLSAALIAALLAVSVGLGDLAAAVSAVLGVFAGVLLARLRLRDKSCLKNLTPVVIENLGMAVD